MTQISSNTFDLSVFDLMESTFLMEALNQGVNPVICSKTTLASVLSDQILKLYPRTSITTVPYGDKVELSVKGPGFTLAKNNLNYVSILKDITQYLRPGFKTFPGEFTQESFRELQLAHPEAKFTLVEDPDGEWQTSVSWTPAEKSKVEKFLDSYRAKYSMRPNGRITAPEHEIPYKIDRNLSQEYKDRTFVMSCFGPNYVLTWTSKTPKVPKEDSTQTPKDEAKSPVTLTSVVAPDLFAFLGTIDFFKNGSGSVDISQPLTNGILDMLNDRWKNQIFTNRCCGNKYQLSWTKKPVSTDTFESFLEEVKSLITQSESGQIQLPSTINKFWWETLKVKFPNFNFVLMTGSNALLWTKK